MKSQIRQRITPWVPFVLEWTDADGAKQSQSFKLSYDLNAFMLIEQALGISMFTDAGDIFDTPSATNTSVLLWAAVQENHPEYEGQDGLRAIRTLLTVSTARVAIIACSEAYITQLPEDKQKQIRDFIAAKKSGEPVPLEQSPTPTV